METAAGLEEVPLIPWSVISIVLNWIGAGMIIAGPGKPLSVVAGIVTAHRRVIMTVFAVHLLEKTEETVLIVAQVAIMTAPVMRCAKPKPVVPTIVVLQAVVMLSVRRPAEKPPLTAVGIVQAVGVAGMGYAVAIMERIPLTVARIALVLFVAEMASVTVAPTVFAGKTAVIAVMIGVIEAVVRAG
jgi:hypothetical protein